MITYVYTRSYNEHSLQTKALEARNLSSGFSGMGKYSHT